MWSVTLDETWIHNFDLKMKMQSKEWKHNGSPVTCKVRQQPGAGKIMASIFWDTEGILMIDCLYGGHTITGDYYVTQIKNMRDAIKEKRQGKLKHKVLFYQDNASPHTSAVALAAIN